MTHAANQSESLVQLIHETLAEVKLKNPSYSMRAFAKRAGVLPSTLSEILRGRGRLTRKTASKLLKAAGRTPEEIRALTSKLSNRTLGDQNTDTGSSVLAAKSMQELKLIDQFELISEWYCLAIFSLAYTEGWAQNKGRTSWVAKALGLRTTEAESGVQRLERLGMLLRDESGLLLPSAGPYRTTADVPNPYIRQHHLKNIELAERSMREDPFELTDYSSITVATSPKKLVEFKRRLAAFRREQIAWLEDGPRTHVYRMSTQVFPLTDRQKKPSKKTKKERRTS